MKFSRTRSPFNHPSVMYKKEVLDVGGYSDLKRKQDLDLFVRMLHNGTITKNIPKSLLYYRSDNNNYTIRKTWIIANRI